MIQNSVQMRKICMKEQMNHFLAKYENADTHAKAGMAVRVREGGRDGATSTCCYRWGQKGRWHSTSAHRSARRCPPSRSARPGRASGGRPASLPAHAAATGAAPPPRSCRLLRPRGPELPRGSQAGLSPGGQVAGLTRSERWQRSDQRAARAPLPCFPGSPRSARSR